MILLDATPLQSEHRLRGLGTYTLNLARELVDILQDEICFATTRSDLDVLPVAIRDRAISFRRGHRPAQVYWVYNEWFLRRVVRRVRPTIIHSTDFNGLVVPQGVPTVATLHDMTVLKEGLRNPGLSGRMSDLRWWIYYYRKLPKASHIIAISDVVKDDAVSLLGIPENQITVVPHGVDVNRFVPDHRFKRTSKPYLLFVGGRNRNKNFERVLEAFVLLKREFAELLLFIAGAWSDQDLLWLKERTIQLQMEESIRQLGYVPDEQLPSLYTRAEVFLLPSLEEGFGLPILEAMSCGTPVVTSNRGAMHHVAGQAAQLVDPESVESIARGIRDILTMPRLKDRLIELGLKRALEFSWRSAAKTTAEIYNEFSSQRSHRVTGGTKGNVAIKS